MTKTIFSERNTFFMEIISCDPSVYRMDHLKLIASNQKEEFIRAYRVKREGSGSVIECLTRDLGAADSSLTSVIALLSLSKTHLSELSSGSTQEDLSLFN